MSRFRTELATAVRPLSRADALRITTRGRLEGPRWRQTSRGFYVPVEAGEGPLQRTTAQRIVEAVPLVPPRGAIGGWAAAYVHGADWLDGRHSRVDEPVTVLLGSELRHHHPTSRLYRGYVRPGEGTERAGIPVTVLPRTAFDCARWAPNLREAVVALDALLHFSELTVPELTAWLPSVRGWRGVVRARLAATLATERSLSPWETRLRMLWVLGCGLPTPLVNATVIDAATGQVIGAPDLLDVEHGLAIEYDGDHHRDPAQHHRDNHREEALEQVGLTVMRVDRFDLRRPNLLVRRLLDARSRAGRRRPSRVDWEVRLDDPREWSAVQDFAS